jgi:hypothetical protein
VTTLSDCDDITPFDGIWCGGTACTYSYNNLNFFSWEEHLPFYQFIMFKSHFICKEKFTFIFARMLLSLEIGIRILLFFYSRSKSAFKGPTGQIRSAREW